MNYATFFASLAGRIQNAEHIVLAHDDVLRALQRDLVAGVFSKKDTVAGFDVESHQCAILQALAVADGHNFALLRFLLGGVGDDDAIPRGFLFVNPLHHDAVI